MLDKYKYICLVFNLQKQNENVFKIVTGIVLV